jgi:DsbC/DsbD-like thiol-disulfide interchange protein
MCCSTTCHPGASEVSLSLNIGKQPIIHHEWQKKFSQFDRDQPRQSLHWTSSCLRNDYELILKLTYLKNKDMPSLKNLKLFTEDRIICSNTPLKITKDQHSYTITAKTEKYVGDPPSTLNGILSADNYFEENISVISVSCNIN